MRTINMNEENEIQAFAKRAAAHFSENSDVATYSDKGLSRGCLLALRWGMGEDCVVVVKLSEGFEPINYTQLIKIRKNVSEDDKED